MHTRWLGGASADARRIVLATSVRALGDGATSMALAVYLSERGLDAVRGRRRREQPPSNDVRPA